MALLSSALSSCVPAGLHHRSTAIDSRLLPVGAVPSHSKFVGVHGRIHHVAKSAMRAALTADAPSAKPDTDFLSYKTELLVIIHISTLSCTNFCSFYYLLGCSGHHGGLFWAMWWFWYSHSPGCHGSWGRFWKFCEFGGETQDSSSLHLSNECKI